MTAWMELVGAGIQASQPTTPVHPRSMAMLFMATGFIGWVITLVAAGGLVSLVRRWRELAHDFLAPPELVASLLTAVGVGSLDRVRELARASRTYLGIVLTAGLVSATDGAEEMSSGAERQAAREALRLGDRVANLARLAVVAGLAGVFGTVQSMISSLLAIECMKAPSASDIASATAEALCCTAIGACAAVILLSAFFVLDHLLTSRLLAANQQADDILRAVAGLPST